MATHAGESVHLGEEQHRRWRRRCSDRADGVRARHRGAAGSITSAVLVGDGRAVAVRQTNAASSRLELADGGLLAHEVARPHRPPEHIVLAACELPPSHIQLGDEPLGFAGAMQVSGSRTVVTR